MCSSDVYCTLQMCHDTATSLLFSGGRQRLGKRWKKDDVTGRKGKAGRETSLVQHVGESLSSSSLHRESAGMTVLRGIKLGRTESGGRGGARKKAEQRSCERQTNHAHAHTQHRPTGVHFLHRHSAFVPCVDVCMCAPCFRWLAPALSCSLSRGGTGSFPL